MKKNFIIDFDSTFTQVEALDLLTEIVFSQGDNREIVLKEIKEITNLAMSGKLDFRTSLEKRISLLKPSKKHIDDLITELKKEVSVSFKRNKEFFEKYRNHIYIISNGFKEFIVPIVKEYGIKQDQVFANTFRFNKKGIATAFDRRNVLSSNNGKVKQIKNLKLPGEVFVIGDGYTDYEIKMAGLANKFFVFTENVERKNILQYADHIAPSLDELLYLYKIKSALSYPKNRIKVLLLENVHSTAFDLLKKEGYTVEEFTGSLSASQLEEKIKDVSILGIRSKTKLTKKVLTNARKLIAVGAHCIGTNQVDLLECTKRGIIVFNAPFSNTRSVVEMAIAEMIFLLRKLPDTLTAIQKGKWNKTSSERYEIRGKKLGIIGYGNIGSQLSVLAESLGMEVYYFDIEERLSLGNARKCKTLKELLSQVEIVSLHVDGRVENKNMLGDRQFDWMSDGAYLLNLSRGNLIDLKSLKKHLKSGKLKGAALDVFPEEPLNNQQKFHTELMGLPNLILTPHIGGSTEEAQENIANFVPNKIMEYVNTGQTTNSVNFPNLNLPELENAHRLIHIHHNISGILANINNVLANHKINILGQYLKTNETIGYVITDIDKKYNNNVIVDLKKIEGTIKFRVLY